MRRPPPRTGRPDRPAPLFFFSFVRGLLGKPGIRILSALGTILASGEEQSSDRIEPGGWSRSNRPDERLGAESRGEVGTGLAGPRAVEEGSRDRGQPVGRGSEDGQPVGLVQRQATGRDERNNRSGPRADQGKVSREVGQA